MQQTFDVSDQIKKLKRTKLLSFILIGIGVIRLPFMAFGTGFTGIGAIFDYAFFPCLGVGIFVSTQKRIKLIEGSFISFHENGFSFKSRKEEALFETIDALKAIEVKLKTISVTDDSGKAYVIHTEDYNKYAERKAIKERFEEFKNRISKP